MSKTALHWFGHSLVVVVAVGVLAGCADEAPLGPEARPTSATELTASPAAAQTGAPARAVSSNDARAGDLGSCPNLQAPAGSKLALRVYANGVQIYHWNGTSWSFDGPLAELSADPAGRSTVGIHYSGPTWESMSGGKVVGTVLERCTPDPAAIPWLALGVVSNEGPGIFHRVTFIQRVNTVGGLAPSANGSSIGEEARVPYTTEYLFYRAK